MSGDVIDYESECRAFGREYPTMNVRLGIQHAANGTITWANLYRVFQASMAKAMSEVAR